MIMENKTSHNRFYKLLERASGFSPRHVFIANIIILLLIASFDYLTGEDVSLAILYFVPVSISAWYLGREYSWVFAFLSILCWIVSDLTDHFFSNWIITFWNTAARMGIFIIVFSLIDAVKKALEKEKMLARIDSLTGLSNSRNFYEAGEREAYRAERYKRILSIAYMDVDNFKQVNDEKGHDAGDTALKNIGGIISRHIRASDIAARLGGDEFAFIFPETDAQRVLIIVNNIKSVLDKMAKAEDLPITFSIGIVTCVSGNCSFQQLIKHADAQMYRVKKNGKNNISWLSI